MSRTTRNEVHGSIYCSSDAEARQTKQVRGQGPSSFITMKAGMRVGDQRVGGSKSKRVRQWKRVAKRRASKRRRQETQQ